MRVFSLLAGVFSAVLLTGCTQFEYAGREFAPLAEGMLPRFYASQKLVPAGVYTIIGRAELTAERSVHWEDLERRLLEEAASRGADAVAVVSRKLKRTAVYEDDSSYDAPSSIKTNPYNLTPDGAEIKVDMAGKAVDLPAEYHARYRIVIRALFYKNKEQLEKIVSRREKQLEKLINKPQSLPGATR